MKSFLTALALCFCTLALGQGSPTGLSSPILTNFFFRQFEIHPELPNTQLIKLHLNTSQFDEGGDTITLTNLFGPGTTNIFQTFITTNLYTQIEYVTNLYVTYLVSSNSISGNIQGTPPHLSMFFPDNFSLADSIVTQNADTNGVTVNGTGDGSVTLGPSPGEITVTRSGSDLQVTNATGMLLTLSGDGTTLNWGDSGNYFQVYRDADNTGFNAYTTNTTDHALWSTFLNLNNVQAAGQTGFSMDVNTTNLFWVNPIPQDGLDVAGLHFNTLNTISTTPLLLIENNKVPELGLTFDGKIQVGGSATNLLYRDGANLVYTNGFDAPYLNLYNKDGRRFGLGFTLVNGNPRLQTSTGFIFHDAASSVFEGNVIPDSDDTRTLGSAASSGAWHDSYFKGTHYVVGFNDGLGNHSWAALHHTGTNGYILLSSQALGTAGAARPFVVDRNLGAILTTGDATFVDMFAPSQTNALSGDLTFAHATNGMTGVEFTHVRTFYNSSGANRTVTLAAAWVNPDGAAITVTNNGIAKLYVNSMGDTSSAGLQTNVMTQIKYFK